MSIKIAILNPQNGSYDYFDNTTDLIENMANNAINFYMQHTHDNPFSTIETLEDGSEIWRNSAGDEIPSPEQIEAATKEKMAGLINYRGNIPITNMSNTSTNGS
jgi:hypothetical protein